MITLLIKEYIIPKMPPEIVFCSDVNDPYDEKSWMKNEKYHNWMHYKDESLVNKWKWKIWRKEVT
jgi:hypothetical protein